MADDTTDTTPGAFPGALRTGEDGSVPDLGGRRAWVWMQDTDEGGAGRFDVRSDRVDLWRRKGATVVPDYPINFGPAGRTAKARRSSRPAVAEEPAEPAVDPGPPLPYPTAEQTTDGEEPAAPAPPVEEPAGDEPAGDIPPAPAGGEQSDETAGEPAGGDTKTRRGGRR
ncbi:hypothetical protein ACIBTV_27390 [Micromonospora sp. NPDC049366]|uniref:hypothetical protein n=1 Tax=Micromonospora sp. NPDC049366 TaxID=3364271 RepID=UPI00379050FF